MNPERATDAVDVPGEIRDIMILKYRYTLLDHHIAAIRKRVVTNDSESFLLFTINVHAK
jgi:hypothetical protein